MHCQRSKTFALVQPHIVFHLPQPPCPPLLPQGIGFAGRGARAELQGWADKDDDDVIARNRRLFGGDRGRQVGAAQMGGGCTAQQGLRLGRAGEAAP